MKSPPGPSPSWPVVVAYRRMGTWKGQDVALKEVKVKDKMKDMMEDFESEGLGLSSHHSHTFKYYF